MAITLSQLYSGATNPEETPPLAEFDLVGSFSIPALNATSTLSIPSAEFFGVGQFVFLSDGVNYANLQITAIAGDTLTLLNYGGKTNGVAVVSGGKIVPSGRDIDLPSAFVDLQAQVEDLETNKLDAPGGTTAQYIRGDGSLGDQSSFSVPFASIAGLARDNADLAGELEDLETAIAAKFNNPAGTISQYLRGDGTPEDFPEFASTKTKNIESISATKTLTVTDAYFQYLTPTVATVIVKLPNAISTDYFESEIVNDSATNAITLQEFDGTGILSLSSATTDKVRSVYVFWDGSIWRVFERSFY
jgi:hypothetical protein